jgi:hypothetical protein
LLNLVELGAVVPENIPLVIDLVSTHLVNCAVVGGVMMISRLASVGAVVLCMLIIAVAYAQTKPAAKSITVYQDPG